MNRHTLYFEQINANTCRAITPYSGKVAWESLSYKDKAQIFDEDKGREVIIDVTKSFARKGKNVTFPSGLISFIMREANQRGHECEFAFVDSYNLKRKLVPQLPGIKFEPYQSKMFRKVGIYKRGILVGPTGMGKSVVLGGIVDKMFMPETLLIVPTKTIFNQLYLSFCNWFGRENVGRIGNGCEEQRHITICLYQSISKYKINRTLKMILIDEVHLINDTIVNFLKKCKNVYYRYGVTATPQKINNNFSKTMQMMGSVGDIIVEVTDKEAISRVLPVKVKLISYYCGKPTGTTYQEVLRNDLLMSPLRNAKLLKAAFDTAISKGMTCLYLLDETKQGELVYDLAKQMGIPTTFVHGKLHDKVINQAIKDLDGRKIPFVIATKVFGVGTDIPNVDCVVLGSARKSEIDTLQKIGRGRRRVSGSKYLIVIDSVDKVRGKKYNQYFYNHSLERLNVYKEKEWQIDRLAA